MDEPIVTQTISFLADTPLERANDFQLPPDQWPRKIPVLGIDLPAPPEKIQQQQSATTAKLQLTIKSLKPALTFQISVSPTDTVADLKALLAAQPNAPSAESQRLLYKGKALADARLLKEYDLPSDAVLNLMSTAKPTAAANLVPAHRATPSLDIHPPPDEAPPSPSMIPSLVLSPTPVRSRSGSTAGNISPSRSPVSVNLDLSNNSLAPQEPTHHASTAPTSYHTTITDPAFWKHLHGFLQEQFKNRDDASSAFEEFLVASKNELSITDIAKIRDTVGIFGMGGT
ncbi:hypothetical protein BKA62DRAFT_717826 [Auriculariales sp. MPI-PUGE-AT-0066]|nr:hypothetical protein BKA62DRAFT_717826 [Auriculariales sp. MPI-PUGE-AT-0066]